MQDRPSLTLNRLVVMGEDSVRYYDQSFRKGLNVIYGTNSSGKTTILDFIYYALGGDVKSWREGAKRCFCVAAELQIAGDVITIRRDIDPLDRSQRPALISWGDLDLAFSVGGPEWLKYSYSNNARELYS